MEEKIKEIFDYINEVSNSRKEKLKKIEKLNHLILLEVRKMCSSNEIDEKTELENIKAVLTYLYYNFNSFYELNNKYEKGFDPESEYLGVYIGRFDVDKKLVKILDNLVDLIGTNLYRNEKLEIYDCPGVINLEMLRLKKVYK